MCDVYPDVVASVWTQNHPRARKQHRCHCCSTAIESGQRYTRTFMLCDGEAYDEKLCVGCATAQKAFGDEHRYFPGATELEESLDECVQQSDGAERQKWRRYLRGIKTRREGGVL